MRIPGSRNRKDPARPIPVVAREEFGAPLTVAELTERLDEVDVPASSRTPTRR